MNEQLKAEKTAEEKISPKRFSELLKCLELETIYLKDVRTTLHSHDMLAENSLDFSEKCALVQLENERAVVEVSYTLVARSGRKRLISIKVQYCVVFSTTEKLSEDFFTIYNKHSLPLQTFPYFRDLTNSMFSRSGLPPLVLPLRKYLVGDSK